MATHVLVALIAALVFAEITTATHTTNDDWLESALSRLKNDIAKPEAVQHSVNNQNNADEVKQADRSLSSTSNAGKRVSQPGPVTGPDGPPSPPRPLTAPAGRPGPPSLPKPPGLPPLPRRSPSHRNAQILTLASGWQQAIKQEQDLSSRGWGEGFEHKRLSQPGHITEPEGPSRPPRPPTINHPGIPGPPSMPSPPGSLYMYSRTSDSKRNHDFSTYWFSATAADAARPKEQRSNMVAVETRGKPGRLPEDPAERLVERGKLGRLPGETFERFVERGKPGLLPEEPATRFVERGKPGRLPEEPAARFVERGKPGRLPEEPAARFVERGKPGRLPEEPAARFVERGKPGRLPDRGPY